MENGNCRNQGCVCRFKSLLLDTTCLKNVVRFSGIKSRNCAFISHLNLCTKTGGHRVLLEKMTINFVCELILVENCHVLSERTLITQEIMRSKDAECNSVESPNHLQSRSQSPRSLWSAETTSLDV